jgi:hypothetical protein
MVKKVDDGPYDIPPIGKQGTLNVEVYVTTSHDLKSESSAFFEGLTEYLSRPARRQIVQALCRALVMEDEIGNMGMRHRKRGRPPTSGSTLLAARLDVSRQSIIRWLNNEMQSSNSNASKILSFAKDFIPETLFEILQGDVKRHIREVEAIIGSHGDATYIERAEL